MFNQNATQERVLESQQLRVRFFWHGDRYAHEVLRRVGDDWQPALVSVEGSPQEDWPASPPFQSLHIEAREDGRTLALLVGMAGKSHWSASIEIEAALACVSFDVACRVRDCEVGPLGSTYCAAPGAVDHGGLRIDLTHRFGAAEVERQNDGVWRVVATGTAEDAPQTVRWDYRLCLDR